MDFRKGRMREDPEINLIPFIDVLMVILIFLMITTTYSRFTELQIVLPTADAEKSVQRPFEINVGVDAQNRYAINNARISYQDPAGLAQELKKAAAEGGNPEDPVIIINADATAAHQTVINVLEAARIAGFPKVTFAAQTGGKK
ncbi:biopolymer transporter ExbD [Janthinobacterium sp. 17J80-10]|uniref:ExbD/TolR family protein n=1 Tax=Janthinobacterium sp. 17J80-10 TaxID=2497863 RepID=UPI001005A032|nr:biopolymer transporter ExbD [Janthinobacterium sp. 17J80-10]QAU36118.1 biopolymer transporter ExbD [Janthinobacterium sp. 17J80-10]